MIWLSLSDMCLSLLPGPTAFQQASHKTIPHSFRQENPAVQEHIFLSLQLNLCPSSCCGPHFIRGIIPCVFKYIGKRKLSRSTQWSHCCITFPTKLFWTQGQDPGAYSSGPPDLRGWLSFYSLPWFSVLCKLIKKPVEFLSNIIFDC